MRELLAKSTTFATPVLVYMVSQLGVEVLEYEPETIEEYLLSINPDTDKGLIKRVVAASGLYTSDLFWVDPFVFSTVCRALNRARFPESTAASIEDMAWGVLEASLLMSGSADPSESPDMDKFSDTIIKYIKYTLKSDAMSVPPQSLDLVGATNTLVDVDDEDIIRNMQEEADRKAGLIDNAVNTKLLELLKQLDAVPVEFSGEYEAVIKDSIKQLEQFYNV